MVITNRFGLFRRFTTTSYRRRLFSPLSIQNIHSTGQRQQRTGQCCPCGNFLPEKESPHNVDGQGEIFKWGDYRGRRQTVSACHKIRPPRPDQPQTAHDKSIQQGWHAPVAEQERNTWVGDARNGVWDFPNRERDRRQNQRGSQVNERAVKGHRRTAVGGLQLASEYDRQRIEKHADQNKDGPKVERRRAGPDKVV